MNKSINYRKDHRTTEQFEKDIRCRTNKERFLIELFIKECEYHGKLIRIENNGVDNSGQFMQKSNCNADYSYTHDGKVNLLEVKCSPVSHKCTFKVYNLQQYIKQEASILLFYGVGKIDKDPSKIDYKNTRWAIIVPEKIQQMLDEHEPYKEYLFGNKMCIQIKQEKYDKYFKSYRLTFMD